MKKILLALLLLVPAMAAGQTLKLENINIVRSGYWQVVSPDTITNHTDAIQAVERQLNLLLQGIPQSQIVIKPPLYEVRGDFSEIFPDTVYAEVPADTVYLGSEADTVWAYEEKTVYATSIPDTTVMYYDEHPAVRNIEWQIIEDHPDSTYFRVRIYGQTTPEVNQLRFASKCIGYDSTRTLLTDNVGLTLTPDSTGYVDAETRDIGCHPPGGNAAMNYWLTAVTDTMEIQVHKYIDIAHIRSLGN